MICLRIFVRFYGRYSDIYYSNALLWLTTDNFFSVLGHFFNKVFIEINISRKHNFLCVKSIYVCIRVECMALDPYIGPNGNGQSFISENERFVPSPNSPRDVCTGSATVVVNELGWTRIRRARKNNDNLYYRYDRTWPSVRVPARFERKRKCNGIRFPATRLCIFPQQCLTISVHLAPGFVHGFRFEQTNFAPI